MTRTHYPDLARADRIVALLAAVLSAFLSTTVSASASTNAPETLAPKTSASAPPVVSTSDFSKDGLSPAPAAAAAPLPVSSRVVDAATSPLPKNCDIRFAFCNIIDDTAHPRWIFGTTHNADLIGSLSSTSYKAVSQGNGWFWIKDGGGLCWNLDLRNTFVEIAMDSCQPNDPFEEWDFIPVGNSHGDTFIENARSGTHWAVACCLASSAVGFANGRTDGTEYWYWHT